MKRLVSVLILCGIFLSSFFAQEAKASISNTPITIHASGHHQGTQNFHKNLIFSETSNESEDSEQKFSTEIQFDDYENIILENKYIKNNLNIFILVCYSNNIQKSSAPIFIQYRSILI